MRYTEYHAGKAVIKDKNQLSAAMEKLAKIEDQEKESDQERSLQKNVSQIIEDVCEDICDNYCQYRNTCDDECLCDITRNGGSCPLERLF